MEKQGSPFNTTVNSRDVTLAADGMEQKMDDRTIFCTPDPQAASTVLRSNLPVAGDVKGSFLDDLSRLSIQSVTTMDLTHQLKLMNFTVTTDTSQLESPAGAAADSGPDLIQFSAATEAGNSDQEANKSDSLTDVSSRSSMGLIPSDLLNECDLLESVSGADLSSSVLPLATPKMKPVSETRQTETIEKLDSKDWSDNSKQDSKQDSRQESRDMPLGRSQIETVKKRPPVLDDSGEGAPRGLAVRGPAALFAGHLLDSVEEGEELEQSVHQVELGDDDLQQLDEVDFSDLEEDRLSWHDGQDSGVEEASPAKPVVASSTNDCGLDSRYFRETPMMFAGDGEDTEVASSRTSLSTSSQQRGAAEGEHLLTKLRRQFMSGDGSENEIDTEDELEAVRKSQSLTMQARERALGADEEDTDRSNLPLPAGLEDEQASGSRTLSGRQTEDQQIPFSFLTRQSAEGDAAQSPVPWNVGQEGDGSSGGDSDSSGRNTVSAPARPPFRYISGAAVDPDPAVSTNQSMFSSVGQTWEKNESGLHSKFFMPTSTSSTFHDSLAMSSQNPEGSTFNVEDILQYKADTQPSDARNKDEDSYLGIADQGVPENPFEGQFANSFGSFGLDPDGSQMKHDFFDRSAEMENAQDSGASEKSPRTQISTGLPSTNSSFGGLPAKGSGSFDGPFRKPRAPALPKKKTEKVDDWSDKLEKELKELGIDVGDDFTSAEFAHEDAFNQHQQLARAAEGLAWEEEDRDFSGFLGGQEQADHLETSITRFMAARSEPLGTLGMDPHAPRPEFGGPVSSPPPRRYPVKLVSPPSTSSSILTNSRSEGEGDEEGEKTLLSGDNTLMDSQLSDPPPSGHSLSPREHQSTHPDGRAEQKAAAKMTDQRAATDLSQQRAWDVSDKRALEMSEPRSVAGITEKRRMNEKSDQRAVTDVSEQRARDMSDKRPLDRSEQRSVAGTAEKRRMMEQKAEIEKSMQTKMTEMLGHTGTADMSEHRTVADMSDAELSSLLLDLTHAGGDVSMEEALSMSTVLEFIKNHSFTKSSDFASAINKLAQTKKQQQRGEQSQTLADSSRLDITSGLGVWDLSRNIPSHSDLAYQQPKSSSASMRDVSSSGSATCQPRSSSASRRAVSSSGSALQQPSSASRRDVLTSSDSASHQPRSNSASRRDISSSDSASHHSRSSSASRRDVSSSDSASHQPRSSSASRRDVSSSGSTSQQLSSAFRRDVTITDSASHHSRSSSALRRDVSSSGSSSQQPSSSSAFRRDVTTRSDSAYRQSSSSSASRRDVPSSSGLVSQQLQSSSASNPVSASHSISVSSVTTPAVSRHSSSKLPVRLESKSPPTGSRQESLRRDNSMGTKSTLSSNQTSAQDLNDLSYRSFEEKEKTFSHKILKITPSSYISPRRQMDDNQTIDSMEPTRYTSNNNPPMPRQQTVGMEIAVGRDSTQLDVPTLDCEKPVSNTAPVNTAQRTNSSSVESSKPTLLTSGSLLRTEFAQKYLIPGQSSSDHTSQSSNIRIPPERLVSDGPNHVRNTHDLDSVSSQQMHHSVQRLEVNSVPTSQRHQPPTASTQILDDTGMTTYYELNEDLLHSTLHAGESSALGSFWGKSPLFQSTPAWDMGKMSAVSMKDSPLDERELITPGTSMVTPRVQRKLIDIERNVDFPEFCCLGVSQRTMVPLTNRTSYGVVCRFSLVHLLHNGKTISLDQQCPFEMKPRISIGGGATENMPVLFVSKQPGEHVCHVEVVCQSFNPALEPTTTTLQLRAVAEVPGIEMFPSVDVLPFGEVTWGGCVSKTIKLRNVKKASLPVRLSIWLGQSVWHCFTFDHNANSSDLSLISMSSRPESLGRNITTVILPGCENASLAKTVEITVFCRPPKKELNRALAERPAEQVEARIDVEVDMPVQYLPPLLSMVMNATVGLPRLVIPPSDMKLTFKTEADQSIQEKLQVHNAGNITLDLSLSVTTFLNSFTLSPPQLSIKPGGHHEVAVLFSPEDKEVHHYQSLLVLEVEPEGPTYEIPLDAVVKETRIQSSVISILTSQNDLCFHGVPLKQTKSLQLRLFNKDPNRTEHACIELRQSSDCFKLVSTSGEWQQKCEVVLEPREKVGLTIIFCPGAVEGYTGKLVIRKWNSRSKFSIHLTGYGGSSALALSGACLTHSGHQWLELGSLSLGRNIIREITLTNSGVRAAFVKASAFYDMPCEQAVPAGRVAIEPNNFVLAAGCSMKVMVAMSPSQKELDLVKERKEVVAVVKFLHGDEVMRQKYKRACAKDGIVDSQSAQAAFRQTFTNEAQDSVILEGRGIPDSPDDYKAFGSHLHSQRVALLAKPASSSSSSSDTSALSNSAVIRSAALADPASIPTHDTSLSNTRDESSRRLDSTGQFVVPKVPGTDDGDWTVKPDTLSLTVGDTNQKILQLINYSKHHMRFEMSWPQHSVVAEPQKGELKPRSKKTIEVWPHMAWQKRLSELPWRGAIVVTCNGQEKNVRVIVQIPVKNPAQNPVQNPAPTPMLSVSSPNASPVSSSGRSSRETARETSLAAGHSLHLVSTNIHFSKASVNKPQESVLEVSSTSTEPVRWRLSAFAPAYVKGSDDTNTVKRADYDVFTITPTTADLLPQETMKVPVKFCPQTKGTFTQHWEIEYWSLATREGAAQEKMTTKFSLTAEVKSQEASSKKASWDPVDQDERNLTRAGSNRTPLQEKHPNTTHSGDKRSSVSSPDLKLMDREVTFSTTKVGSAAIMKIEFVNSFHENVDIVVDPPKPPFKIRHKQFSITKKRALKYPIEFSPTSAGSFASSMIISAPKLNKIFTVPLNGTAV